MQDPLQYVDGVVDAPVVSLGEAPQELISERTQIVDMPLLQMLEELVVPQHQEEIVKVIKLFPALFTEGRISERTVEQIVDVPVPQVLEQIVEVAKVIPQERISKRIVVQTDDDVAVPQILKEVVEVVKAVKNCPSGTYFREDL